MTKLLPVAILMSLIASPAWSQVPNPCPPVAAPSTETTGSAGTESPARQPVERSAILPSIGGQEQSASPTVQQKGKSVEAQTDCPKPPNQLNAPKPAS